MLVKAMAEYCRAFVVLRNGIARKSASAGFTLLELIIVLTIIGVVIGMAVPYLGRHEPSVVLAAAAAEIRAVLRAARITAIAEDRVVAFGGTAEGGYRIDGRHHSLAVAAEATSRVRVETAGGSRISFFPSGGSSGGRVVLRSASDRREIEIDAITGDAVFLP